MESNKEKDFEGFRSIPNSGTKNRERASSEGRVGRGSNF